MKTAAVALAVLGLLAPGASQLLASGSTLATGATAWTTGELFGPGVWVPVPLRERLEALESSLQSGGADAPAVALELAGVQEALGLFDAAEATLRLRAGPPLAPSPAPPPFAPSPAPPPFAPSPAPPPFAPSPSRGNEGPPADSKDAASREALLDLAAFLHRRLRIAEEVLVLEEVLRLTAPPFAPSPSSPPFAPSPSSPPFAPSPSRGSGGAHDSRLALFDRLILLIDSYRLPQFDAVEILRRKAAESPGDFETTRMLLERLAVSGEAAQVRAAHAEALARFPEMERELLAMKREFLERIGADREIDETYLAAVIPGKDRQVPTEIAGDYLDHLRSTRRLRAYRLELARSARSGEVSTAGAILLVEALAQENRIEEGARLLERFPRHVLEGLGPDGLGQLHERLGRHEEAARKYLAAYLAAQDPPAREGALHRLFGLLSAHPLVQPAFAPDAAGALVSRERLDSYPGFVGGLLSLLFNSTSPAERFRQLGDASREWSARGTLLELARVYENEFPASGRGQQVFLAAMEQLEASGEHSRVARLIAERLRRLAPPGPSRHELLMRQARAHAAASEREREWEIYRGVLSSETDPDAASAARYLEAFDALTASLGSVGRHQDVLELYWKEIERRPEDVALYEKLLSYLTSYGLAEAELDVYKKAIRRFPETSWTHRLARWYLAHERREAFRKLSRGVVDTFSGTELESYLNEFLGWHPGLGAAAADEGFFLAVYRAALDRHPRQVYLVKRLSTFLESRDRYDERAELLRRHCLLDAELSREYLQELTRRGELEERIRLAREAIEKGARPAYRRFLADGLSWLCRYEEALPHYEALLDALPDDRALIDIVTGLRRSFGKWREALGGVEAASSLWPEDSALLATSGELAIEAGEAARARTAWDGVARTRPGDPARYLEAATIYWDYFDFGRAAELLQEARRVSGDELIHAASLAAVHESAGELEKAVEEYVNILWKEDLYDYAARRRLVHIARGGKKLALVERCFEKLESQHPRDPRLVLARTEWLQDLGDEPARSREFLRALDRHDDLALLETVASHFENLGHGVGTEKALKRLLAETDGDRGYRLRLAAFLESSGDLDGAARTLGAGLERGRSSRDEGDGPQDGYAAAMDLVAFHERHGRQDALIEALEASEEFGSSEQIASARRKRSLHLLQAGRTREARELLEGLLSRDPLEPDYLSALADMAVMAGDPDSLGKLYGTALDGVRRSGLAAPEKSRRVGRLREDFAARLLELDRPTQALDQLIERINLSPLEEAPVRRAHEVASAHGLLERLGGYYRKTAEKSFKDFRWNVVLARLFEIQGRLPDAVEEQAAAIRNEPHRVDLRTWRGELLERLGRHSEAAEEFRQLYDLDNRDTAWLERAARSHARSGDMQRALGELERFSALASRESRVQLSRARLLDEWGLGDETVAAAGRVLALERESCRGRGINSLTVAAALELVARWDGAASAFQQLVELWTALDGAASQDATDHVVRSRYEQAAEQVARLIHSRAPGWLLEYASDAQITAAVSRAGDFAARYADARPAILEMAREAALPGLEEKLIVLGGPGVESAPLTEEAALRTLHAALRDFAAEERLIEERMLAATSGGYHASLRLRLAELARLQGRFEDELAHLTRLFEYAYRGTRYYLGTPAETAYLALLKNLRRTRELSALAASPSLFRINWFLAERERDLAVLAVGRMPRDDIWKRSKELLVRLELGDPSPEVEELFDGVLGPLSVGGIVSASADRTSLQTRAALEPARSDRGLTGEPWFAFADRRAKAARARGDLETHARYGPALVEEHPLDPALYAALGAADFDAGDCGHALERYRSARRLADRPELTDGVARSLACLGRTTEALEAWGELFTSSGAGVEAALSARESMERSGLATAARGLLEEYAIAKHAWLDLPSLERLLRAHGGLTAADGSAPSPFVSRLVDADAGRVELLEMLVDEGLVAGRAALPLLERSVDAVAGGAFADLAVVARHRLRLAAAFRELGLLDEALRETEHVLQAAPHHEEARLEKLRNLVRQGPPEALEASARQCLGADIVADHWLERVRTVLVEEGRGDLGARVAIEQHLKRVQADPTGTEANLALAEALLRNGESDRGIRVMRELALARAPDEELCTAVAEMFARNGQPAEALVYREKLRSWRPGDRRNLLEIAELFLRSGKAGPAEELVWEVLFGRGTGASERDGAIDLLASAVKEGVVDADAALARCREALKAGIWPRFAARAEAALELASGDAAAAVATLQDAAGRFDHPASIHRELALHHIRQGEAGLARDDALRWWRQTRHPEAALACFRAEIALGNPERALSFHTPPGCPEFSRYAQIPAYGAAPVEPAELESNVGAVYATAEAYARDASRCLEAVGELERAAHLLIAATEAVENADAAGKLRDEAAALRRRAAERDRRLETRLVIGEGLSN